MRLRRVAEDDPELIFSVTFTGDNGTDAFGNNLHLYWVMWYDNSAYTTPARRVHRRMAVRIVARGPR